MFLFAVLFYLLKYWVFPILCSAKPACGDFIGVDPGTANSCAAVMEGKVRMAFVPIVYLFGFY